MVPRPARRLTLGARRDTSPRWSPDGATLAFLSDRSGVLAAGGAGDRADRPRGGHGPARRHPGLVAAHGRGRGDPADAAAGGRGGARAGAPTAAACASSRRRRPCARRRTATRSGRAPARDARLIDRLQYQLNGVGFTYRQAAQPVGRGRRQTAPHGASHPARRATCSPPGARMAGGSRSSRTDIRPRTSAGAPTSTSWTPTGGPVTRVTGGRGDRTFGQPAWSPDGSAHRGGRSPVPGRQRLRQRPLAVPARGRAARPGPHRGKRSRARCGHQLGPRGRPRPGHHLESADGAWLVVRGTHRRFVPAVAGPSVGRSRRAADHRRARHHPARRRRARHGSAPGDRRRRRRPPVGRGRRRRAGSPARGGRALGSAAPAPRHRPDGRGVGRGPAGRTRVALARGRRPSHPGLVPGGAAAATADRRRSWSRSTAARPRSTAGRSCGSGSAWSRRASASTPATRAGRRDTARTSATRTSATGATVRCGTSWPASMRSSRTGWSTRSGWASPAARTAAT